MSCTIEQIQKACEKPLAIEKVSTPEWGGPGHVYVRAMGADEADAIEKATTGANHAIVGWCVLCVCDKERRRLFDDTNREWLAKGPMAPLLRCSSVAMRLNGATEDLAGNLPKGQADGSPLT